MPNPFRPGTSREQIEGDGRASDPPGVDSSPDWGPELKRAKQIAGVAGAVRAAWAAVGAIASVVISAVVWGATRASVAYVDDKARAVASADQATAEHLQAEINAVNESRAATLEALKAQKDAIEKVGEQVKELRGYLIRPTPASSR